MQETLLEAHRPNPARRLLLLAALFLISAIGAIAIDFPLSRFFYRNLRWGPNSPADASSLSWQRDLDWGVQFAELFGHAAGAALIALAIYQLDPAGRWRIPRILTAAYVSGLAANLLKSLVVRSRPHSFRIGELDSGILETFGNWLPMGGVKSGGQSMPSGHTALAAGLAAGLVWAYPRGRWLFCTLAALVACQRIASGAHWLSDTLMGAALGCLVSTVCLYLGPLPRRFAGWEANWRGKLREVQ